MERTLSVPDSGCRGANGLAYPSTGFLNLFDTTGYVVNVELSQKAFLMKEENNTRNTVVTEE